MTDGVRLFLKPMIHRYPGMELSKKNKCPGAYAYIITALTICGEVSRKKLVTLIKQ
ncbi:MAG: hypothetical protein ABI415_08680 [Flavitalea sp.]